MESRIETSELQQLVGSDGDGENEEGTPQDEVNKVTSPVKSNKVKPPYFYFNLLIVKTDVVIREHKPQLCCQSGKSFNIIWGI